LRYDAASFAVTHNGTAVTDLFKPVGGGVWEMPLAKRLTGKMSVSVKDKQGNVTRIERRIRVGK